MKKILTVILILLAAAPCYAKEEAQKTILLNGQFYLKVVEQPDLSTVVSITSDERTYHMATVENAAVSQVKKVRFCRSCPESCFIALYDRSSTYGATTGIIAWQGREGGWYLQVLPFSIAGIEDKDNDGVFELVDRYSEKMKYKFRYGLVSPE